MAHAIRVVDEQEIEQGGLPAVEAAPQTAPTAPQIAPEVVAAIQGLNARLQAVEGAIQGIPKAAGITRALIRALGSRVLVFFALAGCLALAGSAAFSPTWPKVGILGIFILGVQLPLVAVSYFRGS